MGLSGRGAKETGNKNPNGKERNKVILKISYLCTQTHILPYLYPKHIHMYTHTHTPLFMRCFANKIEWEEQLCREVISWCHWKGHPREARGLSWQCSPGCGSACPEVAAHGWPELNPSSLFLVLVLTWVLHDSSNVMCKRTIELLHPTMKILPMGNYTEGEIYRFPSSLS